MTMLEQITRVGWRIIELLLLLVILCVLLNIIVGQDSGAVIASVATNALRFLQDIPSGTVVGVLLVVLLYWIVKVRGPV
jgi:hypothetical protein